MCGASPFLNTKMSSCLDL
jgi:hypothetical protein